MNFSLFNIYLAYKKPVLAQSCQERFLVALENLATRTSVSEKLLISLKEAQALTGLSRQFLRQSN